MAEGQVLIKDLLEATEVDDSAYLPIDDGELTKKISVENFNMSSNVTAKAYAEAAAASAQTASDTVANINQKVDQAQGYANAAQTQAGYASTYADNAQTYAGNAQGYANTASGHATNAGASASAASSSADAAADNALLAQSWAEGNTGAREGENTNNARYWANKAQSAAQITIDDHLDPQSTNPVENRVIYNALNDMHTGGSNIEITTTQTSLYGKDVTISDGTTTVTETFDLTGKALFEGVLMTGDLTITSSDGTSTATGTLTVPYFGNYTKAIAFWQATIAVTTTTSQFNGLTVSAKKNGAVVATGTFSSGSASIVVPEAGTYKLEVTLDWQTYESSSISVTDQTTYNATIDGFIAPISLTTPTSEFYGQSISVTRNGVAVPVSLSFSNSGTASFTALDEGTYLFTLTYGGEPYTASVVVSAETTYSAVIKMWTATINITTASSQMQSQDIDVYKGSAKVATIAFNASGQASYLAHESGTYHFVCTVDGYPFTSADVVVSEETVYSTSITYFGATLNISTSSSDLYSQTITIKKGSTVVGTTAFSAQGSATYTVHETGTYTCECEGYSGSATVSAETTYNVTINTIETYHLTVDIYSAASDTLSYTDDNGAQTVTTDATGKATGVSITITQPSVGVNPTITFTSSVAKDPDNLSNDYSKSVTVTDSTTEIYVMPEGAVYWFGNEYKAGGIANENVNSSSQTMTKNANSISYAVSGGAGHCYTNNPIDTTKFSKLKGYISVSVSGSGSGSGGFLSSPIKTGNAANNEYGRYRSALSFTGVGEVALTNTGTVYTHIYLSLGGSSSSSTQTTYALWYE